MTMFARVSLRRLAENTATLMMAVLVLVVGYAEPAWSQHCARCNQATVQNRCNCCPDQPVPVAPRGGTDSGAPVTPADPDVVTTQPEDLNAVDSDVDDFINPPSMSSGQLASSLGRGTGGPGVPGMIGDFFGSNYEYTFLQSALNGSAHGPTTVAVGGGDRRWKYADNNSPFPRNRVFYNFNHFHNAVRDVFGQEESLNRSVFGIEKTFCSGWGSFELRLPFAGTVSSSPTFSGDNLTGTELGNVAMAVKALAVRTPGCAVSFGLGILLPTGDDFEVVGSPLENIFRNESVHLQPFMGVYHAHGSRLFSQFFLQFDFATNGSEVTLGSTTDSLTSQSLLMLDYSLGYWLCRNRSAQLIRGVAPMLELHYTTTVEDQDYGVFRNPSLFVIDDRRDSLNITGGLFMQLGDLSSVKVGTVAPLRDGTDKMFDAEFGVQFSRRY